MSKSMTAKKSGSKINDDVLCRLVGVVELLRMWQESASLDGCISDRMYIAEGEVPDVVVRWTHYGEALGGIINSLDAIIEDGGGH